MDAQQDNRIGNSEGDRDYKPLNFLQRVESHILRRMFEGLFVLIPALVTIWILYFVLSQIDKFVRTLVRGSQLDVLDKAGLGVAVALIALYAMGMLVANRLGRRAIGWQNAVLTRIPIVKSIYGVAKQAADTLSSPAGHRFSRVVFIQWPREGVLAMGFVTGQFHSPLKGETLVAVYIPTVPNPTSGNLAFVPEEDIVETSMTVEDAMKMVFSGGIVLPEVLGQQSQASLSRSPKA